MVCQHKLSKMLNAKWQYHVQVSRKCCICRWPPILQLLDNVPVVQDVLSCWRDLHVSLTRRSDFWSKYCRAPKVAILTMALCLFSFSTGKALSHSTDIRVIVWQLETLPVLRTEGRKLHARRHKMRKSHPGVPAACHLLPICCHRQYCPI